MEEDRKGRRTGPIEEKEKSCGWVREEGRRISEVVWV